MHTEPDPNRFGKQCHMIVVKFYKMLNHQQQASTDERSVLAIVARILFRT